MLVDFVNIFFIKFYSKGEVKHEPVKPPKHFYSMSEVNEVLVSSHIWVASTTFKRL